MTYEYYLNLVKVAAEFYDEDKFLVEVGCPPEISLETEEFIKAIHIIYVVANGSFTELVEGFKSLQVSKKYGIPYRTVQDWYAGKRTMPGYVKQLIGYTMIYD